CQRETARSVGGGGSDRGVRLFVGDRGGIPWVGCLRTVLYSSINAATPARGGEDGDREDADAGTTRLQEERDPRRYQR
ncbi:hypothetical protein, partial [Pseudonocardia asaccharolytica]|uniref:hypothetical protein n=1 Tax=Pseudonocardia asaccharolytica TaxID=54010 RepID=UPI001C9A088C